jgi:NADH:ubiquinone oxidoreductase subunit
MAWKTNPKAAEMYRLYRAGYSLSQVAKRYGRTRQAVHGLFKYRGWGLRPRIAPLPFVDFNGERYTVRNTGYYGRTRGKRTLLHRDVWEASNGPIPSGWDIHHIDNDKTNNAVENLECLPKSEHTRKYSPHNNQYTRGRKKK